MKKVLVSVIALVLAMVYPFTAMAATWDNVDSETKLQEAFADTDANGVIINLSGDIELYNALNALEGQTYVINGNTYVLTNVLLVGGEDGKVTINADLVGKDGKDALDVDDEVHVEVNGDIDASEDGDIGVNAADDTVVKVNGDVAGYFEGVDTDDNAQVTVTGNVSAVEDNAIEADDEAKVIVDGNVSSEEGTAIYVFDEAQVTVGGDVTSNEYQGIYAEDDAQVTVGGDVTGGSGDPDEVDMTDGGDYSDGETGVEAYGNAVVKVEGNVTGGDGYGTYGYGGTGVEAYDNATVEVGGNVTGGDVTADPEVEGDVSYAGIGVYMDSTANVSVGGNVTGGTTNGKNGKGGNGAYIRMVFQEADNTDEELELADGSLTVGGTIQGGKNADGSDAEGVYFYFGTHNGDYEDLSELTVEDAVEAMEQEDYSIFDIGYQMANIIYYRTTETMGLAVLQPIMEKLGYASMEAMMNDSSNIDAKIEALGEAEQQALLAAIVEAYNTQVKAAQNLMTIESLMALEPEDAVEFLTNKYFYNNYEEDASDTFWLPFAKALGYASVEELYTTNYNEELEKFAALSETVRKTALEAMLKVVTDSMTAILEEVYVPQITTWKVANGESHADTFGTDEVDLVEQLLAEMTLYTIKIEEPANGTLTTDVSEAQAGDKVTVKATPADGYRLSKILLNGEELKAVDGVYSFIVPENGGVELSAEFVKKASPKTGDTATVWPYMALAALAAAAVAVLVLKKRNAQAE